MLLERFSGKDGFLRVVLVCCSLFGFYLVAAWASYSPLDNAWTTANSVTTFTLNKTGVFGAWCVDLLYASLGRTAFFVPFIFALVPSYYLFSKETLRWQTYKFLGWTCSFLLLMFGLAILAHNLVSPTPNYLSGGFIGSLFSHWISNYIGMFGTLIVGMLLTIVGFYFCTTQSLFKLSAFVYQWVFPAEAPRPQMQAVEEEENSANEADEEKEHEAQGEEAEPTELQPNSLTTKFTPTPLNRPNIIGLKTENDESALPKVTLPSSEPISPSVAPNIAVEGLTNVAQFMPKTPAPEESVTEQNAFSREFAPNVAAPLDLPLPIVSLNETSADNSPIESESDEPTLPKIRLNTSPTPALPQTGEVPSAQEQENVPQFQPRLEALNIPSPVSSSEDLQKIAVSTPLASPEIMPEVAIAPQQVDVPKTATSTSTYPKGYGSTLIHPLLQQPTRTEKPSTPLPTLDLLEVPPVENQPITEQEIIETSRRLEEQLNDFGVKATVEDVLIGPVVTRYEIQPAAGTKASKIMGLGPDLARALVFSAIRITDRVPNKPYMGIETPNRRRETVWLRDVLDSEEFRHSKAILPMALGKDISGKPIVEDLDNMRHLLVAGQTGSGKSVGVNTIILSILYKLTPDEVRLIMIDPKQVELAIYDRIPHLLTPVVTDMKHAANVLNWVVEEMERRYAFFSVLAVRDIHGYNKKIDYANNELKQPIPNPLWRPGDTMDHLPPPLEKLSRIVVIVDEFADLLMTEGKKVEEHIIRIGQKARAAGIHLILATQRPSADIVTGLIKSNIPGRIAFTVTSQIDSRTILDCGGAESLLGNGDMLYANKNKGAALLRIHGAFMTDADAQRVADDWRARGKPNYVEGLAKSHDEDENTNTQRGAAGELDPLFDEAVAFVIETNTTSINSIQRRFGIGFPRAAKIVDQMEKEGILSAPDSRNKREVLAR